MKYVRKFTILLSLFAIAIAFYMLFSANKSSPYTDTRVDYLETFHVGKYKVEAFAYKDFSEEKVKREDSTLVYVFWVTHNHEIRKIVVECHYLLGSFRYFLEETLSRGRFKHITYRDYGARKPEYKVVKEAIREILLSSFNVVSVR